MIRYLRHFTLLSSKCQVLKSRRGSFCLEVLHVELLLDTHGSATFCAVYARCRSSSKAAPPMFTALTPTSCFVSRLALVAVIRMYDTSE